VNTGSDRRILAAQLERLGLAAGDTVLVQASMRRVAPGDGQAATVVNALLEVLGPTGTLVVPTYTAGNSTTSRTYKAAVANLGPDQTELDYRRSLPAFDPRTTPSSGVGALAETVRTLPGARRSSHPQTSFAAVGALAGPLTAIHDLDCHLGPRSPLGALYEARATALLLGVSYDVCTVFHLAEYRYAARPKRRYECRIAGWPGDGWTSFDDIDLDDSEFASIGTAWEAAGGPVRVGQVGGAEARLFAIRDAVQRAQAWLTRFAT
jgi:aminoglycoside 3-N-acetyltransferase